MELEWNNMMLSFVSVQTMSNVHAAALKSSQILLSLSASALVLLFSQLVSSFCTVRKFYLRFGQNWPKNMKKFRTKINGFIECIYC